MASVVSSFGEVHELNFEEGIIFKFRMDMVIADKVKHKDMLPVVDWVVVPE